MAIWQDLLVRLIAPTTGQLLRERLLEQHLMKSPGVSEVRTRWLEHLGRMRRGPRMRLVRFDGRYETA